MAIDSEDKRRSIAGIPPVPDGTISEEDRRRIAGYYYFPAEPAEEDAGAQEEYGLLMGVYN